MNILETLLEKAFYSYSSKIGKVYPEREIYFMFLQGLN